MGVALIAACAGTGPDGRIDSEWSAHAVTFAGRVWDARESVVPTGAGPSTWTSSTRALFVDARGLHLVLAARGRHVYAVEVSTALPDGPVRVEFELGPSPTRDEPWVVAGVFVYRNDANELDLELSRWGDPRRANAQHVLAPATGRDAIRRFDVPEDEDTRHVLEWRTGALTFVAATGARTLASFQRRGRAVPPRRGQRLHINLWIRPPHRPRRPIELVVRDVRIISLGRD